MDHYQSELKREKEEVETVPEKEKEEIREIFLNYGFSENSQTILVEELSKDKDKWVDFMMKFELSLDKPDPNRACKKRFNNWTILYGWRGNSINSLLFYRYSV